LPIPGRYHRGIFGADEVVRSFSANGATTYAMAALNTGWCARFTAPDTRDVWSVWVNWSTVTAPGTVQVRIETIDTTSGKPTGTLYDANAVLSFTPAAGWQQLTFASHPTTGLVAGNEYAVVLLTTAGGTAQTLRSSIPSGPYPTLTLTAADGTTRANFAEVGNTTPVITFGLSDGLEEAFACCPYAAQSTSNIFGTNAAGLKFTVPAGAIFSAAGIEFSNVTRTGTPAGDLRLRIFNSSDATVSGTTVSVSRNSLTGVNTRRLRVHFPAVVSLSAGTYRVVLDSASSANSSNCWKVTASQARIAGNAPSGFVLTTTADVTAGPPVTWTDTATDVPPLGLILDDVTTAAGGVNRSLLPSGLSAMG
jgi:hypothetical protein